jgi:hypothetical protein
MMPLKQTYCTEVNRRKCRLHSCGSDWRL